MLEFAASPFNGDQKTEEIHTSVRSDKEKRTDGMGSVRRGDCPTGIFDLGA